MVFRKSRFFFYAVKDFPQPQVPVALGLLILNPDLVIDTGIKGEGLGSSIYKLSFFIEKKVVKNLNIRIMN